jgi:Glycosyl transferase family 2
MLQYVQEKQSVVAFSAGTQETVERAYEDATVEAPSECRHRGLWLDAVYRSLPVLHKKPSGGPRPAADIQDPRTVGYAFEKNAPLPNHRLIDGVPPFASTWLGYLLLGVHAISRGRPLSLPTGRTESLRQRPDISVCVPVWKRHSPPNLVTLHDCLHEALAGLRGELIVVLNGISAAKIEVPADARVLEFDVNRGVPVAWNQAAKAAHSDVLCFVNDDVVLGHTALRRLWKATHQKDAGVVGPVGTRWDISAAKHLEYVPMNSLPPGALKPCEVVSGFLFATRKHVFGSVGGFDEEYTPCGFEEVDYCTAVRFKLGLTCYAVAGVEYEHKFHISALRPWRRIRFEGRTEKIGNIARRNRRHFLEKWSAEVESTQEGVAGGSMS